MLWQGLFRMPLSLALEKPIGLRTKGRLGEKSERQQFVTGPQWPDE